MPEIQRSGSLAGLTGLRFFAAGLVVCYHFSRSLGEVPVLSPMTWYGRTGVTFFFILSGFVLAWSYAGSMPRWRVFWWRRFVRIWPLLALASALSVACSWLLGLDFSLVAWLAEVSGVHAWFPAREIHKGVNPAAWSLSDEAFFYLVFPILLLALLGLRRQGLAAVAVVTAFSGALIWWWLAPNIAFSQRAWFFDYLPLMRVGQFVLGICLALLMRRGWRPRGSLMPPVVALLAFHAGLWWWHQQVADAVWWGPYSASQILSAPLYAWLIAAVASRDLAGRSGWLGSRWLVRGGQWSFAWYLTHEIVLRPLRVLEPDLATPEPSLANGLILVAFAAGSLGLAGVLYVAFERPIERTFRPLVSDRSPSSVSR